MFLRCLGLGVATVLISASFGRDGAEVQNLTELEPYEAMTAIDSLLEQGILSRRDAVALKARAANRPGYWTTWGAQAAKWFDEALGLFSHDTLSSHSDSVSFYTLLLDFAYFNARACFAPLAGRRAEYAQAEEDCLRQVLSEARLDWQIARAAFELGRFNRFRSALYGESNGNRFDRASQYLRLVLERYGGTTFVNEALWHLTGLLAETGSTDEALEMLTLLERRAIGTKWEERTRRLRSLLLRQEFFIDSIEKDGSRLIIRGQARNIKGQVHLHLEKATEPNFERKGRLPFAEENAGWLNSVRNRVAIDADQHGTVWHSSMVLPGAGVYRLAASYDDTTIACTLGVWDIHFEEAYADTAVSLCPDRNASVVVSVREENGSWVPVKACNVREGQQLKCELPPARSYQVYFEDGTHSGWRGPKLWAPSFEMWIDTDVSPTG